MMSFPAGHYAQNLPYFSLHQVTVKVNKLNKGTCEKIKFSGECKGKHIEFLCMAGTMGRESFRKKDNLATICPLLAQHKSFLLKKGW